MPACRAVFVADRLGKGAPGRGGGEARRAVLPSVLASSRGGGLHARKLECFLFSLKVYILRNSLLVQWLGLSLSRAQVQSLVGELRSRKLCSQKKKQKTV